MSQQACSMPDMAVVPMGPSRKKEWRYMICQRNSIRVGSRPTSMGLKSSTHPTMARVFHSIVPSPQPYRPGWSVSTLMKTQFRIWAFTTSVLMSVIFIGLKMIGCASRSWVSPDSRKSALSIACRQHYPIVKAWCLSFPRWPGFGWRARLSGFGSGRLSNVSLAHRSAYMLPDQSATASRFETGNCRRF